MLPRYLRHFWLETRNGHDIPNELRQSGTRTQFSPARESSRT